MWKPATALATLMVLSALSCRRPLSPNATDAGSDVDATSVGDAQPRDLLVIDTPADVAVTDVTVADVAVTDVAVDVPSERAGDVAGDAVDGGAAMCPAGVAPLDVCGCGCCGEAMGRACYYPS